jgi:hypothetical protein
MGSNCILPVAEVLYIAFTGDIDSEIGSVAQWYAHLPLD